MQVPTLSCRQIQGSPHLDIIVSLSQAGRQQHIVDTTHITQRLLLLLLLWMMLGTGHYCGCAIWTVPIQNYIAYGHRNCDCGQLHRMEHF